MILKDLLESLGSMVGSPHGTRTEGNSEIATVLVMTIDVIIGKASVSSCRVSGFEGFELETEFEVVNVGEGSVS